MKTPTTNDIINAILPVLEKSGTGKAILFGSYDSGAPFEIYRKEQAEVAVSVAESIIQVAERLISREGSN